MKGMKIKGLVLLTFLGDMIIFTTSYFVVLAIKNGILNRNHSIDISIIAFIPIAAAIIFILMQTFDMYKNIFYRTKSDIVATLALIVLISSMLGIVVTFFFGDIVLSRSTVVYAGGFQWLLLSLWRIVIWRLRTSVIRKQKIMIVAELGEAKAITEKILLNQGHLFDIKYIYDITTGPDDLYKLINKVDHVLIGNHVRNRIISNINVYCMQKGKNVFMIPGVVSININKASFIQIDDLPMFNISRFGLSFDQRLLKRGFDIVTSSVALIFLMPFMVVVGLAIKMDSKGPVFFKQDRVTEGGKIFNVYKFRTMVQNAEELTGPVLAADDDPRITKTGAFLRATRIDEIPQIFNVFAGSMSVVGPRPERQFFIDQYLEKTPEFAFRTAVKAGITGLAQVSGKYTTTFDDKLRYDLMYIKNYSFLLDMKILFKTIKVVLTKEASSGVKMEKLFEDFLRSKGLSAKIMKYGYEIQRLDKNQTLKYKKDETLKEYAR